MGARARVGLAAWGAGRVRYQGRLPPDKVAILENYNRTTTDHTTEAQSAQRLHDWDYLQLDDPGGLWASLARQPIESAASLPRVQGSRSRVLRPWQGLRGIIAV